VLALRQPKYNILNKKVHASKTKSDRPKAVAFCLLLTINYLLFLLFSCLTAKSGVKIINKYPKSIFHWLKTLMPVNLVVIITSKTNPTTAQIMPIVRAFTCVLGF